MMMNNGWILTSSGICEKINFLSLSLSLSLSLFDSNWPFFHLPELGDELPDRGSFVLVVTPTSIDQLSQINRKIGREIRFLAFHGRRQNLQNALMLIWPFCFFELTSHSIFANINGKHLCLSIIMYYKSIINKK